METVETIPIRRLHASEYARLGLRLTAMRSQRLGLRDGDVVVGTEARDPSQKSETLAGCGLALITLVQIVATRLSYSRSFYSLVRVLSFPSLGDGSQLHGEPGSGPWPACYP